jgi:hypothetical protein
MTEITADRFDSARHDHADQPGESSSRRKRQEADRWVAEQMFEEDVRAVLTMMRPHRRERLLGWSEYRTGGGAFRATISWSDEFPRPGELHVWQLPRIAEVLETILVGSLRNADELTVEQEFALYRSVAQELSRRIDEMEQCYT